MIGASNIYFILFTSFNLRKTRLHQTILISSVWVISCSLVPLIENKLITDQSIWFVISQFCFISVLCLLFDIKDGENDYLSGVNTYPNKFGAKITKLVC